VFDRSRGQRDCTEEQNCLDQTTTRRQHAVKPEREGLAAGDEHRGSRGDERF
jgi:hypothetical protein